MNDKILDTVLLEMRLLVSDFLLGHYAEHLADPGYIVYTAFDGREDELLEAMRIRDIADFLTDRGETESALARFDTDDIMEYLAYNVDIEDYVNVTWR